MLIHFFDNTKPKGILFCGFYSLFYVILYKFFVFNTKSFFLEMVEILLISILLGGNLCFLNLLKNQNKITKSQNYILLLFVSFINFFPEIYKYPRSILVNCFLLVAFFLLLKVEYTAGQKKNLFDASLCILLATICYDWALLYILLIWLVVFLSTSEPFRNGLIPFVALMMSAILSSCVALLLGKSYLLVFIEQFEFSLSFDFQKYSLFTFIFSVVFWLVLVSLFVVLYFFKSKIKYGISFLMFGYILVSLVVTFISEELATAECIFVALPIVFLAGTQLEKIPKIWLKECILWAVLVSPFVVFLMYCNIL